MPILFALAVLGSVLGWFGLGGSLQPQPVHTRISCIATTSGDLWSDFVASYNMEFLRYKGWCIYAKQHGQHPLEATEAAIIVSLSDRPSRPWCVKSVKSSGRWFRIAEEKLELITPAYKPGIQHFPQPQQPKQRKRKSDVLKGKLEKGDRVRVKWLGQYYTATVIEVRAKGHEDDEVDVQYDCKSKGYDLTAGEHVLRRLAKKARSEDSENDLESEGDDLAAAEKAAEVIGGHLNGNIPGLTSFVAAQTETAFGAQLRVGGAGDGASVGTWIQRTVLPFARAAALSQLVRTKVHQKVELDRVKAANDAQFGTSRAASPQFKMSPEDLSAAAMIAPLAVAVLKVGPPKPPDAAASIVIGPAQAHICASSAGEGKPLVADPGVNKALKAKNERLALWNAFGKASAMTANQQEALQLIPLESHMPEVKLKDIFKGVVIKQLAKQQVKDGVQMKALFAQPAATANAKWNLLAVFKADGTRWLNPPNGRGAKDSDIPDTGKGRSDWVSDLRQFSEHWLPAFDGVCETLRGATRDDGNIASGTAGVFLLDGIDRKSSTQMWNVMELLQTPEKGPACTNVLNQILQTYMKVLPLMVNMKTAQDAGHRDQEEFPQEEFPDLETFGIAVVMTCVKANMPVFKESVRNYAPTAWLLQNMFGIHVVFLFRDVLQAPIFELKDMHSAGGFAGDGRGALRRVEKAAAAPAAKAPVPQNTARE